MFTVHFAVSVPFEVGAGCYVFVTGSHEQLGNWEVDRALKLVHSENGTWTGQVVLGVETVKFRYFIGFYLQSDVSKPPTLTITKWETHLTPRSVLPSVEASKMRVCRANLNDVFGFSGGRQNLTSSWVLRDDQNQIMLTISGQVLKFFKAAKAEREYSIKIIPFDLRNKYDLPNADEDDEQLNDDDVPLPNYPSFSHTDIAVLTNENDFSFREQLEFGQPYHINDYIVFRTQSVAVEHLSFRIELYYTNSSDLAGIGYALPSALHDTYGKTSVPLLSKKGLPIGKIYFEYLFVRSIKIPTRPPIMNNCYARHWKKRTTLEVGHRGMGNSYTKCAVARENTLHSLNSAAKYGADLVEFDVHLTKDRVPIIFHDFHVLVSVAKRANTSTDSDTEDALKKDPSVDFYQLAVKDLNLNQLQLLHLDHIHSQKLERSPASESNGGSRSPYPSLQRITGNNDEAEEYRPFPTLIESLSNVHEDVGFNIEIKYPQMLINGQNECDGYFERNEFVDIILSQVLNNASHRRIVFSSFDPDICLMLSIKQKKYPVLFLCIGDTTKHVPYMDERTRTSMTAVKFASANELIGVNFNSEDLLKDPSPVRKAKDLGLITFVWGDELAEKKNVEYFKKTLGVEGVIYDRIGENETRSNVFLLERAMKTALFSKKPDSPTSQRCSSHGQLNNQRLWVRGSSVTTWSSPSQDSIESNALQNGKKRSEEYPLMSTSSRSRPTTPLGIYDKTRNGGGVSEV